MQAQSALAAASGVSTRTIGSLERGEKISDNKMRALEIALRWPAYSFDAILAGEPAPEDTARAPARMDPITKIVVATEDELDEIQRIFEKYRGPAEGERFRAWADGVRTGHSAESGVSQPPRERDPR
jgi:transcriptional regulator with XRE-family HTH domain